MSGHKVIRKFIHTFIKMFSYMCLFFFVGYCSYKVTTTVYQENNHTEALGNLLKNQVISEASVDRVANQVIFSVNQETAKVEHIVLLIFNVDTKNIDIVTIPTSTQFTMSKELFDKLSKVNVNIPQIITLSDFAQYFDQAIAYEYGILLLEEVLNTKISFYTTMLTKDFTSYFTMEQTKESIPLYYLKTEIISQLDQLTTREEFMELMTSYYKKIQSNLSLERRQSYITYYLNANYDFIYSHRIEGKTESFYYEINTLAASKQLQRILENTSTYRSKQIEEQEHVAKERIQILNGSGVTGLAAAFEKTLVEEGFEITQIGNYANSNVAHTKIVVKEEGMGEKLLSYFKNATIEVGDTGDTQEIMIILGKDEA